MAPGAGKAILGDANCQINLGGLFDAGKGVPKSMEKAFHWYLQASKNGDIDATYNIGLMYDNGEYVERNIPKAQRYFCDAGEYNFGSNIESLEVVKTKTLNVCKHKPEPEGFNLEKMCNDWIQTKV